jgi:hypothetical protein
MESQTSKKTFEAPVGLQCCIFSMGQDILLHGLLPLCCYSPNTVFLFVGVHNKEHFLLHKFLNEFLPRIGGLSHMDVISDKLAKFKHIILGLIDRSTTGFPRS